MQITKLNLAESSPLDEEITEPLPIFCCAYHKNRMDWKAWRVVWIVSTPNKDEFKLSLDYPYPEFMDDSMIYIMTGMDQRGIIGYSSIDLEKNILKLIDNETVESFVNL